MDDGQRQALERVVQSIRDLIESVVMLDAPEDVLLSLAKALEDANTNVQAHVAGKPIPKFGPIVDDDPGTVLPYSPVTGALHPMAPPVKLSVEGDKLVGRVIFGEAYEGPHAHLHGSIVAAVYDQVLAIANIVHGTPGPTGQLNVTFRAPTPLHRELVFEAWTERVEGRKVFTRGHCLVDGDVVTEAEGIFIQIGQKPKHRPWHGTDPFKDAPDPD